MCGLCGVLGAEEHWSQSGGRHGPMFGRAGPANLRQERLARIALTNRVLSHYGLHLSDWQGRSHLLKNKVGQTEVIDAIAAIWPVAERLAGRVCDPLEGSLLERLEQS